MTKTSPADTGSMIPSGNSNPVERILSARGFRRTEPSRWERKTTAIFTFGKDQNEWKVFIWNGKSHQPAHRGEGPEDLDVFLKDLKN